jgi:two-component system, NarL family, response regulator NreC
MTDDVRVLLADDHAILRQGLKLLLESQPGMRVVGEAADGAAAVQQAQALKPDVIVMDISMPGMNGLIATRTLKELQPDIRIVVLTRHEDQTHLEELLRAGAAGYVSKQSAPEQILAAIRATAGGGLYLDPALKNRMAAGILDRPVRTAKSLGTITARESEVLRLVARGHTNKEIAAELSISAKTVDVHKTNAMRKLGLTGRVDIVRYGVLQGWLFET